MSVRSEDTRIVGRDASVRAVAILIAGMLVCSYPSAALAQGNNDSHFAVNFSVTPKWTSNDSLAENLLGFSGGQLEGKEFTIGVGRGSTRGGDWSVSYVSKPIDDTTVVETDQNCFSGSCSTFTNTRTLRDVRLSGVEFNWSRPFVTIKNRVQIGISVGGGVASTKGTVDETMVFTNTFTFQGKTTTQSNTETLTSPASEVLYSTVPLIKLEAQGAVILHPTFKVKFAGGMNNPSAAAFRISLVYLIGAKS